MSHTLSKQFIVADNFQPSVQFYRINRINVAVVGGYNSCSSKRGHYKSPLRLLYSSRLSDLRGGPISRVAIIGLGVSEMFREAENVKKMQPYIYGKI